MSPTNLDKEQKIAFQELRQIVDGWKHLSDGQKVWLDDSCLLRYLRARKFKVKKAKEMLVGTVNWRASFKPHLLAPTTNRISEFLSLYVNGHDAQGHPVCYMRFVRDPTGFSSEEKLHFILFIMEEAIREMDRKKDQFSEVEKLIFIIDLAEFSMTHPGADTTVSRKWADAMQNHYPERLFKAYLVRSPAVFSFFWMIVSPFLDKVTADKICFVSKSDKKLGDFFTANGFDASMLESDFGGTMPPRKTPLVYSDGN